MTDMQAKFEAVQGKGAAPAGAPASKKGAKVTFKTQQPAQSATEAIAGDAVAALLLQRLQQERLEMSADELYENLRSGKVEPRNELEALVAAEAQENVRRKRMKHLNNLFPFGSVNLESPEAVLELDFSLPEPSLDGLLPPAKTPKQLKSAS